MHSVHRSSPLARGPVVGLALQVAALAVAAAVVGIDPRGWVAGVAWGSAVAIGLSMGLTRAGSHRLGPADVVTLARAVLIGAVAALVASSGEARSLIVVVSAVALVLDAVDGRVARATATSSPLGARFDMECDAFLILVLSCAAAPIVGWWVLLIGAARYALWLAGRLLPWLAGRLPYRYWRKAVAAIQGVVLTVVVSDVLPVGAARVLTVVALLLLTESFGRDVIWLWRRRVAAAPAASPVGQAA